MSVFLRAQADDFLNAFRILKESHSGITSPIIVNLAFALELYIKDLYFTLGLKAPKTHNILKLFEKLPKHIQQNIMSQKTISENPFTTNGDIFSPKKFDQSYTKYERFIDQIKPISDGFEKWRYSYEHKALKYESWFAIALIEAVKSTADKARTDSKR